MSLMNTWTDCRDLDGKKNNLWRWSHMSNRWKHTINSTSKDVEMYWRAVPPFCCQIRFFFSNPIANREIWEYVYSVFKYLQRTLWYMNLGKKISKQWIFALILTLTKIIRYKIIKLYHAHYRYIGSIILYKGSL